MLHHEEREARGRDAARSLLLGGAQTHCAHWRGEPYCGHLVPRLSRLPRKSSALDGIVRPVSLPCCHHVEVRSVGVAMQRGMVLRVTSTPEAFSQNAPVPGLLPPGAIPGL